MMDLLVACVEAGVSIDSAVTRVAAELVGRYPNLAMHLNIIALELRAGRSRYDAWSNFSQRLGLEEADSLATMLRQAEEMGTSIGKTLRIYSREMRQKRILIAEERALALSAKLTVPLIVFVFPVMIGVLLLPPIIKAMEVL
ncbi:MAG: type II secretion system F family protein [Pseudomonadota bacterium]